jgi:LPXTG-site transpeptidase (sortase) family protein
MRLEIPVINVKAPIVGVEQNDGSWDVSWLQDQVGWLNGTAYPTWRGNSLLTAHVVGADGKPGVFSRLKSLGAGEYIFVYNAGYRYTYEVESNAYVQPEDRSVMKHEEKSYLTLITCDSYDEQSGTYLRRVVVRTVLVDVRAVIQ